MGQSPLLHDALGQQTDLSVEEKEAREVVAVDEAELLFEARLHLRRDAAVPPCGRLAAELLQVALRGVARGHVGLGQAVA